MNISLHHLTISEVLPEELIEIGAALKCDHVDTFLKTPFGLPLDLPVVRDVEHARALRQQAARLGISICSTETFIISEADPADYAETLEIASALGALKINCIYRGSTREGAVGKLRLFARMAAGRGITVVYEWSRFSLVKTLADSLDFLRSVDEPNVSLNVDVLHLIRNGELPADLAGVEPRLKSYAQISDGPLVCDEAEQLAEARGERAFPGSGEFPLLSFVQSLPADAVLAVEAPVNRMRGALGPLERAQRAVLGAREILQAARR